LDYSPRGKKKGSVRKILWGSAGRGGDAEAPDYKKMRNAYSSITPERAELSTSCRKNSGSMTTPGRVGL